MANTTITVRKLPGKTQITIVGIIDEQCDLSSIEKLEDRSLEFNLEGVRRLNSVGIQGWINLLQTLTTKAHLVFVKCSPAIIDQLNMIQGFLVHGTVRSFYAVMVCESCDTETKHLFQTHECRDFDCCLPAVECDRCGRAMQCDEDEDRYLLFLREPTMVGQE